MKAETEDERMEQISVLVADDDREIVESIAIFLKAENYDVIKAYNGREALEKARENSVQLIILLSAKSEDSDKIFGLTAGADDYVTKPFNPSELVARVKSQLRRYTVLGSAEKTNGKTVIEGLVIDNEAKSVSVDGDIVRLTPIEFKILELLAKNRGRVFSADEIYRRVWNEDTFINDSTIAVHIRHIREKIEINPKEPHYLKVVWGVGYRIE